MNTHLCDKILTGITLSGSTTAVQEPSNYKLKWEQYKQYKWRQQEEQLKPPALYMSSAHCFGAFVA
jgi:hypothetical protein